MLYGICRHIWPPTHPAAKPPTSSLPLHPPNLSPPHSLNRPHPAPFAAKPATPPVRSALTAPPQIAPFAVFFKGSIQLHFIEALQSFQSFSWGLLWVQSRRQQVGKRNLAVLCWPCLSFLSVAKGKQQRSNFFASTKDG